MRNIIDNIQSRLAVFIALVIGVFLSLYFGRMAGQGQSGQVFAFLVGVVMLVLALRLQEYTWFLVPICWPLYGQVKVLPLPFTVRDLAAMYALAVTLALVAFKRVRVRPKIGFLDALLVLNGVWLLSAFIRNPTGFLATDAERVGGRPYVDAIMGFMAYWVMARMRPEVRYLNRLPILVVGAVLIVFLLNILIFFRPEYSLTLGELYTGFDFSAYENENLIGGGDATMTRFEFFRDIGRHGSVALCAYLLPTTLLNPFYIKRFSATAAIGFGLLLSGFRSFVVYAGAMFVMGTYFRGNVRAAVGAVVIIPIASLILVVGNGTIYQLPFAAQRALGFLPSFITRNYLDEAALGSGTESTRWRYEMWVEAMTTDRFIEDKLLGDGFGISKRQVQKMDALVTSGVGRTVEDTQYQMAMAGDFHSGPISAIRVVGYVGLLLYEVLIVCLAFRAWRFVRASSGTPLFKVGLFFAMPIIFEPLWYNFIFGGYNAAMAFAAFGLGILKAMENSLAHWRESEKTKEEVSVPRQSPQGRLVPGIG